MSSADYFCSVYLGITDLLILLTHGLKGKLTIPNIFYGSSNFCECLSIYRFHMRVICSGGTLDWSYDARLGNDGASRDRYEITIVIVRRPSHVWIYAASVAGTTAQVPVASATLRLPGYLIEALTKCVSFTYNSARSSTSFAAVLISRSDYS